MTEETIERRCGSRATPRRLGATAAQVALVAVVLTVCGGGAACTFTHGASDWARNQVPFVTPDLMQGARIMVTLGCRVSSAEARAGDAWHGTVSQCVWIGSEGVIPPGSEVSGVVTAVSPARGGAPGMLQLGIESIRVNGHVERIAASSAPVVAGSALARNLFPSSSDPATGSPDCQIVLADVSVMTFVVDQTVAMR